MRILLDTHVWLWMIAEPDRLGPRLREALSSRDNALFLSAASAWEIAIKHRLGKLPLPEPPRKFIAPRLLRDGVTPLPVEIDHASHVATLPHHHRDPFDRLLVAQAALERMSVATVDPIFERYGVRRVRV